MAILRRAETQAQSEIGRLGLELLQSRTQVEELEKELRVSKDAIESAKKDNNKLAYKVRNMEAKLKSTEAQVSTLLAEKQRSFDEHAALERNISDLETACQRFRRRAVQRSSKQ